MAAAPCTWETTMNKDLNESSNTVIAAEITEERIFRRISRRELLKLSPALAASLILVPGLRNPLLRAGVHLSDLVAHASFRTRHLAPTFADGQVAPLERFPFNSYDTIDPEVDLESWSLSVSGLVSKPREYRLAEIRSLPKLVQNTRHVCIEGWSVIGNFGGARISDFLEMIGSDPKARFVEVECADDYYESIDIESAMHPQSLLCYEMYGQPLTPGHGAPLRLQMPTKLGYKQAKYLTSLRVTNVLGARKGYWEDLGYSWHGGI
jgi:DMSO/TMAO reductase YedYZ molybdopterin-dependent catalytic subunit